MEFTDGAIQRILSGAVQFSGGNLVGDPVHHDAVLTHQHRGAVLKDGHHGGRAFVEDDLPGRDVAVGASHLPLFDVENLAVIYLLPGEESLPQGAVQFALAVGRACIRHNLPPQELSKKKIR